MNKTRYHPGKTTHRACSPIAETTEHASRKIADSPINRAPLTDLFFFAWSQGQRLVRQHLEDTQEGGVRMLFKTSQNICLQRVLRSLNRMLQIVYSLDICKRLKMREQLIHGLKQRCEIRSKN